MYSRTILRTAEPLTVVGTKTANVRVISALAHEAILTSVEADRDRLLADPYCARGHQMTQQRSCVLAESDPENEARMGEILM